jgi:hypothetical protein
VPALSDLDAQVHRTTTPRPPRPRDHIPVFAFAVSSARQHRAPPGDDGGDTREELSLAAASAANIPRTQIPDQCPA